MGMRGAEPTPWWGQSLPTRRVPPAQAVATRVARTAAGPISMGVVLQRNLRSQAAAVSSKSSQGLPILALLELLASPLRRL
mmetsp:Transcript_19929/g.51798  ORF Transcript_19929/g.51798 Transcript_19929/m.51798 type:complete len:81 (+) Transcript_19929:1660-1902(+)